MNKIFKTLLLLTLPLFMLAQTGPVAPSNGIWALIDTSYTVGTTTQGVTKARLTLKNTTSTKVTGVQFRVFYDKVAFTNASVALVGSSANLDLEYITNTTAGNVTITLVYVGSSSTYSLPDGETFELTFTHAAPSIFNTLSSIDSLKWSGISTFPQYASTQAGMDTTLGLYSYNGEFKRPKLNFKGTFMNVNGTGAKNLTLSLEKTPKGTNTWTQVASYTTNVSGKFSLSEILDTTYWDVRLAVKGDTMGVGNVISTADAQLINQWVLGTATPAAFDFYTADVNNSKNITISDVYGVFGRIAGRFTSWPNSVKDIKFFTATEYATITGTPSTNYTSTISGTTNFYYNILPGQPDSVTYYVVVPGDANSTGYHMARITPTQVVVNGPADLDPQIYRVIDQKVEYDFPTSTIEVNVPRLKVDEGNLVNIPVKVLTGGISVNALQFGLKYDSTILSFKGAYLTEAAQKWLTYVNTNDGEISWGGYDPTSNQNAFNDGSEVVTLQFAALKPQLDWGVSPLYTSNKYAGSINTKDLNINPANGIIQVRKMSPISSGIILDDNTMQVYPNPTSGPITITFRVAEDTKATLGISDMLGVQRIKLISGPVSKGQFTYYTSLGNLSPGVYVASLVIENDKVLNQKIIKQN